MEGDRIPLLERYRQPLKQEHVFSSVLSDRSYAFADLLDEFNSRLAPCACRLECNRDKEICETDRAPYLAVLLADALLPAAPASVAVWLVRLGVGVRDCYILRHWFALVPTVAVWCHSVVCHPAAAKS